MAATLTPNAIIRLNGGDVDLRPVLQVMDIRQIGNSSSTQERFRLVLSDGKFVQQAMLATQLNEYVKGNQVVRGSIVQLVEYICNTVQNRKIIIVLNMEIRQGVADIVGDPVTLASGAEQSAGVGAAAAVQQQQPQPQPQQPPPHQQFGGSAAMPPKVEPVPYQSSYPPPGNSWESRQGGAAGPQGVGGASYASPGNGVTGYHAGAPSPGYQAQRQMGMNAPGGGMADGGGFAQSGPYGRPLPAYQPPPMYSVKGPIAKNEAPARIVPIAALNPYQGRWTIKARVTAKGDLRRYHNARGEGKVFSFDLLDAEGGEIRCTCFNTVADQFYEKIEPGRVYLVTKGSLKPSQKQFNHLKNEWEILLENSSTVDLCFEEDPAIPQQLFDFKPISEVENMEGNATVDVVGVVIGIQDAVPIMRKNGTETVKRSLTLIDNSGRSVELTMWGPFCHKEGEEVQREVYAGRSPILTVKAGRVSDFSGKSIGTLNTSQILINPDIPEVRRLQAWHDHEGKNSVVASISREGGSGGRNDTRKVLSQIKDENLGRNEKPDWISVRATISFIKADTFCYTACPLKLNDKQCSKKVTNNGDGTWHCDRCDQSVPECDYRYLLQMQVQDHTGVTWINGFQEAGEEIFGVSAKDLFMWKQMDNPKFTDTIQRVLFSCHLFKLKVKEDTYQDEARVKCTFTKSEKVSFSAESKVLVDSIRQMERGDVPIQQMVTPGPAPGGSSYGGAQSYGTAPYSNGYSANAQGGSSYGGYGGGSSYMGSNAGLGGSTHRNDQGFQTAGGGGGLGGGACYHCGQGGHYAKECPNKSGGRGGGRGAGFGGGGFGGSGYGGRGF